MSQSNKPVILFIDTDGIPTQSKIAMTEENYMYAMRTLFEHMIEDHGYDKTINAISYAMEKNNLNSIDIYSLTL